MSIELSILPHQDDFLSAVRKAFDDIAVKPAKESYANPVIDFNDVKIKQNIASLWSGYEYLGAIPSEWQMSDNDDYLGLDIRMETGTGKTYCYTRLMYELNAMYGFHKFILLVPSLSIREGSKNFLEAEYAKRHFADLYPNKTMNLSVLEAQKKVNNRRVFPMAVSEFVRGSRLEKNRFSVLLMNTGMLSERKNSALERSDYDQTLLHNYTRPYDALRATRPIVIIDEPHRFKKENKTYQTMLKKLNPQCVIRFGATFPDKKVKKGEPASKDYNNLIFNLGAIQAFNQNLVKGVETQMIAPEQENDIKLKLMDLKSSKPKSCVFRNELTKKEIHLSEKDSLVEFGEAFSGITVESIGKTENENIKKGVTLSNGQILAKNDVIYGGIYTDTYQKMMLEQSLDNHFKIEKENFLGRQNKIKTLSLYFIDSIHSYRSDDGEPGHLRVQFEELLTRKLKDEISKLKDSNDERELAYKSYLEASLDKVSKTNGGYFSKDNASTDKDIQEEVDKILRDKESLLNFKDEDGNWNTMRFIFSKWTLKEGWDNPNVFQIVKLRSSGSEISKLQEVGRGLRLPVDEQGRRISEDQFYLRYLIDYSEKDFAQKLLSEIQSDSPVVINNVSDLFDKLNMTEERKDTLFGEMLANKYINRTGDIFPEKREELFSEYPDLFELAPNKVTTTDQKDSNQVHVRKDKFAQLRELWQAINRRYYLKFDEIPEQELEEALYDVLLNDDVYQETVTQAKIKRIENGTDGFHVTEAIGDLVHHIDDRLPYNKFLEELNHLSGLPIRVVHQTLCKYYEKHGVLHEYLFQGSTVKRIAQSFNEKLDDMLMKRFSYKPLKIDAKETALTDYRGEVVDSLSQGVLGVHRDKDTKIPDKFLYDAMIYDSPKEKKTIVKSDIDEVVVFGKIPRKSIQIPVFTGGTISPDFMYVINSSDRNTEINFIIETKDMKDDLSLRETEKLRIASAEKFFEVMQSEGVNVVFKKQMTNDDITAMIRDLKRSQGEN